VFFRLQVRCIFVNARELCSKIAQDPPLFGFDAMQLKTNSSADNGAELFAKNKKEKLLRIIASDTWCRGISFVLRNYNSEIKTGTETGKARERRLKSICSKWKTSQPASLAK
jgi:hypothetical protein